MGWAALVGYKVLEALNSENRLEVCKMQHTTGHQARSFRKCILHHLTSFERDEQRSSVKKVSKLWILRTSTQVVIKQALLETASYTTFLKFANSNTQLVIKQDLSKSLSHTTCWEVSKGMSSTHRSKSSRCYEFWEPSWTIAKCSTNQSSSKIL